MKATDLRIDNYYQAKSLEKKEYEPYHRLDSYSMCQALHNEINLKPIPLTEDWLIRLGFEQAMNGWFCKKEYLWLRQYKLNNQWFAGVNGIGDIDCTRIDYVHQLQNLYFALTGEELTIKQP
jgi:hypothetical protein